jgi:cation diffusion facilitator CzcD-associated flavoprotein CzcO
MQTRFAVIGAGAGGLWVYNNDSGLSPAYRSLHINSEARVSSFGDFPFPPDTSLYLDHVQMRRYFEVYAAHFDITRRNRFNSPITAITRQDDGYRLRLSGGSEEIFDDVVVATGHQSTPRHPPDGGALRRRISACAWLSRSRALQWNSGAFARRARAPTRSATRL